MSYKLALHAFVTFTEEVVPIQKHISYFTLNSHDIRSKNSHNETNEKGSGEVTWPHSHYIFIEYLTGLVYFEKWIQAFWSINYTKQ